MGQFLLFLAAEWGTWARIFSQGPSLKWHSLGRTRAIGNELVKWVSAPPQRNRGLALGFGALWVTNERFGIRILRFALGMLWNEDSGLSFVWVRAARTLQFCSCRGSAELLDARREEFGLHERRGGCVHSLFSFQGSGCALWYSCSGGKRDKDFLCLGSRLVTGFQRAT